MEVYCALVQCRVLTNGPLKCFEGFGFGNVIKK